MEEIALVEQLHLATVEAYRVEVLIIWVLALFFAHCGEIYLASLLVHLQNLVNVPSSLGELTLQVTLIIIEVEVCPAVTLAPLDKLLTLAQSRQRSYLDVGI